MATKDEALKMAIEAMGEAYRLDGIVLAKAIQACKEALEQPVQEPVMWMCTDNYDEVVFLSDKTCIECRPLYTHPAPSWQGLSEEEQWNLINKSDIPADYDHEILAIARAIEQALKEKNT
ncbi:hypothetical protein UFOVP250_54 [uncultured Caudovirales phage]|uniref:Uncharacterized protein n=1 Tax=uncultured Caudovirales phage TaxID=2100421 RepID=A0A6J5LIP9_9CAUD|nr:hypothetical protein UFOVP250_54 [uncultured Caudovirales phage]